MELNLVKRRIADDFLSQVGNHDQREIFAEPAGDPGLIGPGTVSWKLHSDVSAVATAGIASIIMELLHPSVMAGVGQQSNYREQPYRRARTTFGWVITNTFGNTKAAEKLIERVKRMHSRVNGTRDDGVPYRALDPELIAWVHTMIPWGVMTAYEKFNGPLTTAEKDTYLARAVRDRADERRRRGADVGRRARGVRGRDAAEARGRPDARGVLRLPDRRAARPAGAAGPARAPDEALSGRERHEPRAALGPGDDRLRPAGAAAAPAPSAGDARLRPRPALVDGHASLARARGRARRRDHGRNVPHGGPATTRAVDATA